MTKMDYMSELSYAMRNYPESYRQEVLNAFEGHFAEGRARGISDEEIIRSLGPVKEVMKNVRQSSPFAGGRVEGGIRDVITGVAGAVRNTANSFRMADFTDTVREAAETIGETLESAFGESGKGSPFDIGPAPEDQYGTLTDIQGVASIYVEGNLNLFIMPEESGSLTYAFRPAKRMFGRPAELEMFRQREQLIFRCVNGNGTLQLTIPKTIVHTVISAENGDIRIQGLSLAMLEVRTKTGKFTAADSGFENAILSSISGGYELRNVFGVITAKTASGRIYVRGHSGGLLTATTESGDISIESVGGEFGLRTTSGDIDLRSYANEPFVTCESVSGDIDVYLSTENFTAELKTSSGDITNRTRIFMEKRRRKYYVIGRGTGGVTLVTKSGDITLHA